MLALCLMLLPSYYAQNYAGIIGSSLNLLQTMVIVSGGVNISLSVYGITNSKWYSVFLIKDNLHLIIGILLTKCLVSKHNRQHNMYVITSLQVILTHIIRQSSCIVYYPFITFGTWYHLKTISVLTAYLTYVKNTGILSNTRPGHICTYVLVLRQSQYIKLMVIASSLCIAIQ